MDNTWLKVTNGDWFLDRDGGLHNLEGREADRASVLRAAVTPYGFMGRWVMEDGEMKYRDGDYGNAIYLELSEPISPSWLARAKAHHQRAMSFTSKDVKVLDVGVKYVSHSGETPDGAKIDVRYSISDQLEELEIDL